VPHIEVCGLLIAFERAARARGELDRRSPLDVAHRLRDALPEARLAVLPGAGHVSTLDRPAAFNAEVRRFLA
jgi:pimeloyl-ACP methyl ester carboxylesterase